MTSTERSRKHEERNPGSAARRKANQRSNEAMIRFYVRQLLIYERPLPDFIDKDSQIFKSCVEAQKQKMSQRTEVV